MRRTGPSLLVPSGSVANTTGRTFVIRVRGGRTEWVDVKTGLASGPLVEVYGDLKAGDEIAARGTDELRAGAQVHTKPMKPSGVSGAANSTPSLAGLGRTVPAVCFLV